MLATNINNDITYIQQNNVYCNKDYHLVKKKVDIS